ncbi:FG-GAP repeat domain-containing protein [Actinoplanes sp. CA-030573]|uniref:FG-GAP repeat domain-containing protein n=1 Tax=Actinoplanes sp. CA-030573 TaxID=3239898 RepID=UPI003D8E2525
MRVASPSSIILTAAFFTTALTLSAAAPAAADPAVAKTVVSAAPCQPDGVAATDRVVAGQLRPAMNGRRLGASLNGYNVSCARAIVDNVRARGLNQRAATIAVTAAITESTLHNYTVEVDHDSLGLFQQRPSQGWGQRGELVDPRFATQAFLTAMMRKHPAAGWQSGDIGQICQRVQGSAYPLAYAPETHDAALLVAALWPRKATPGTKRTTAPVTKPAGPFQRSLLVTATSQAPTDARHDLVLADWNGDRRPDLVVVQRGATAGGHTQLTILDGTPRLPGTASSFQRLLLDTSTALGPADERTTFSLADWNGDGKLDLVAIQKSGTASGRTELRVLDGASFFQRFLVETATPLGPTDDRYDLTVTDWNGDGKLDLVAIQKSGAASGRTEIRVLNGATSWGTYLQQSVTALGPTDGRHDLTITDWNGDGKLDLAVVQKSGTASGHTEIRVLNGAAAFKTYLQQSVTALGPTDDRYDLTITDWNGDGKLDLVAIQKSGAASGRTEATVLAG